MTYRNRLLSALPSDEMALLAPHLVREGLRAGRVLVECEQPIGAVWFPEDGVVSQVSLMADGSGVETATIGHEGMVGLALFHGVDVTPEQTFVQVPGSAHRMDRDPFRDVLPRCPTLVALLHRYAQALFTLVAQSSGCNRKHPVEARCARWLLLVHDRVGRDRIELTQLFLSQMLGVRRATVTVAAGLLQKMGAIRYTRGRIDVVDRERLEQASCECYAIIRSNFDRLLAAATRPSPLAGVLLSTDGITVVRDGAPISTRGSRA